MKSTKVMVVAAMLAVMATPVAAQDVTGFLVRLAVNATTKVAKSVVTSASEALGVTKKQEEADAVPTVPVNPAANTVEVVVDGRSMQVPAHLLSLSQANAATSNEAEALKVAMAQAIAAKAKGDRDEVMAQAVAATPTDALAKVLTSGTLGGSTAGRAVQLAADLMKQSPAKRDADGLLLAGMTGRTASDVQRVAFVGNILTQAIKAVKEAAKSQEVEEPKAVKEAAKSQEVEEPKAEPAPVETVPVEPPKE